MINPYKLIFCSSFVNMEGFMKLIVLEYFMDKGPL